MIKLTDKEKILIKDVVKRHYDYELQDIEFAHIEESRSCVFEDPDLSGSHISIYLPEYRLTPELFHLLGFDGAKELREDDYFTGETLVMIPRDYL